MSINVSPNKNVAKTVDISKGVGILVPALIGLLVFLWFTGGSILRPTNISWIMSSLGDPVQHYVGWQSFRHTPVLQWPIGRNWNYGEDLATSIVFTDSLPLFALIFKPISAFLPAEFQYFGLWILTCFMLQAIFAWALIEQLVQDRMIAAIAAGIFALTPAMLWRCYGHESLIGQWILLAALNVYFSERRKTVGWTLVLCVASLIHAYLLAMSLAIWATDAIRLLAYRLDSRVNVLKRVAVNFAALICTMWAVGYFYPGSVGTSGYGAYRFDLLSPINPENIWSIFFTGKTHGSEEGFAYLGAGVILLVVIDLALMVFGRKRIAIDRKRTMPIAILSICLLIYAISNHVGVNGHIFTYPLPQFTTKLTSTFRASGRFAWPGLYLVVLGAIVFLARSVNRNVAIGILGCIFLLQAADLSKASEYFKQKWSAQWTSPLTSQFWADASRQYKRVSIGLPTGLGGFDQLAVFATANGMPIDDGQISRINVSALENEQLRTTHMVETKSYDPDTLYIFPTRFLWSATIKNAEPTDFVGEVNGYKVYAPNWRGCVSTCGLTRTTDEVEPYRSGNVTSFGTSGGSDNFTGVGWSIVEQNGRWTDGDLATLGIYVGKVTTPVRISFDLFAFTTPSRVQQRVEVLSSGKPVAEWTIGAAEVTRDIVLDAAAIDQKSGIADVTFRLPDHTNPLQAGVAEDARELGIFVKSMTINY
jgi:Family of unknown function (DUF6311)